MADLVGEAYVRVTADTTAMRRAIKNSGKEMGDDWSDSFTLAVNRHAEARARSINDTLARAMSDPTQFDRLAKNYASPKAAARDFNLILQRLTKTGAMNSAMFRESSDTILKWRMATEKANLAAAEHTRAIEEETEARRIQGKQLTNFFRLQETNYRAVTTLRRKQIAEELRLRNAAIKTGDAVEKSGHLMVDRFRNLNVGLVRVTSNTDRFNWVVGRAFGKGSRNNFLNWTGSMVHGLMSITTVAGRAAAGLAGFGARFSGAFAEGTKNGLGFLTKSGRALTAAFGGKGGVVGALAAAGVGAIAFGKILPGVVSLMSMLGGVASSLVGTMGIGLTGSFLALVPAIGGAVAGIGALASVFTSFFRNEQNRAYLKNFMKPWEEMNRSYYPQVRKFLDNVRAGFDDLITDIRPSIDTFFTSFQQKMNDPTTRRALAGWSDAIGKIATSLSGASTSFLSGLTGFFVPVLPFAERLGRSISTMATDFDRWANSARGRNQIADFMDKAWVAADKTFRVIGNLGGIIGDIAWGGLETGTSLMDGILGKFQELNTWLDTTEGKAAMKGWFADAKGIGKDIGTLAGNVGEVIKNLNSPEARESAKAIMGLLNDMGDAAAAISRTADAVGEVIDKLQEPLHKTVFDTIKEEMRDKNESGTSLPKPIVTPTPRTSAKGAFNDFVQTIKINVDDRDAKLKLAAIEAYRSSGVKIPVAANPKLWEAFKGTVAQEMFETKSVPVKGNEEAWNKTKGTVAAHVFDTKDVPVDADTSNWDVASGRTQAYGFKPKTVNVNGNDSKWKGTKANVTADKFNPKTVYVSGQAANWNRTKGTVDGYRFQPKTVTISANASSVSAAVANVRRWLASLPASKTIRIAGVNSVGGTTMAQGGVLYGPHRILAGEAGPEAVVPLNRPLHMVDPSVRWLSAIAQNTRMAAGGVVGAPARQVVVESGAIVVNAPNANPGEVAQKVIDRLAEQFR